MAPVVLNHEIVSIRKLFQSQNQQILPFDLQNI